MAHTSVRSSGTVRTFVPRHHNHATPQPHTPSQPLPPPPLPLPPSPSSLPLLTNSPLLPRPSPEMARPSLRLRGTSCFCFDLCTSELAGSFVRQTRDVVIGSRSSRWWSYLSAVYGGRAPLPFELGRLNFFYENTLGWRTRWPGATSPFRDCSLRKAQHRACNKQICKPWRAELNELGRGRHSETKANDSRVDILEWAPEAPDVEQLRSVQVFTRHSRAFGRELYLSNQWIEVVRQDNRPLGFQEGMLPPNCSIAASLLEQSGNASGSDTLRLPVCDWSAYPPGCFMRPVVGSGVWMNTGRLQVARHLYTKEMANIRNPVALSVVKAVRRGVDTLQWAWGDAVFQGGTMHAFPPLLVSVRPRCIGRQNGVRICLPSETRGGWHDIICACNETLGMINCAASRTLAQSTGPSRSPPSPLRLDRWVPATSVMIRMALFCAALALVSRSRLSR